MNKIECHITKNTLLIEDVVMPKVSIIIPAYNAEKYLPEALNSAINQTLADIEIIIVDDASSDNTLNILNQYSVKDKRIQIVKNETNMGILASRYNALQISTGKYVMFLDADDRLVANACELLSSTMEKYSFDLVQFNTMIDDAETLADKDSIDGLKQYLKTPNGPFPHKEGGMLEYVIRGELPCSVWNKIYNREVLLKALMWYKCERIQMSEDFLLTIMVLSYVANFGVVDQALYVYRFGPGMSTGSLISEKSVTNYALMSKVDYLLKKWIPNTGIDEVLQKKILEFSEKKIHKDILDCFVERIPDGGKQEYIKTVNQYWGYKEFVKAYVDYVQCRRITPEKALKNLKITLSEAVDSKTKTIGMFYNRLYNGGVERVISLLTPILLQCGYDVIVITEEGPTVNDYKLPDGVKHIKLTTSEIRPSSRVDEWQFIISKYHIDTVIYHAWVGNRLVLDSMAIKSTNIQLILYAHGSFQYIFRFPNSTRENYFKQNIIYSLFDKVVVLSEVDKEWAQALGLPAYSVMNPLTFEKDNVKVSELSAPIGLWVGRLSAEKQYYDAFNIAKLVHSRIPGFRLRVVGKTERNEEFQKITEYLFDNNMAEYVLLDGEHSDVAKFYSEASVFLMTSEFEGFAMVLQEAKVFGLPIVSYELPNITLQRQKNNGFFVVPQRDVVAAAEATIELLENSELRLSTGEQSRRSVDTLYADNIGDMWRNIIESPYALNGAVPAYLDKPINSAIRMAMDNIAIGFENAMKYKNGQSAKQLLQENIYLQTKINFDAEKDLCIEAYRMEISYLRKKVEQDRIMLNNVYNSKTYKIGNVVLWPLKVIRKIISIVLNRR